MLSEKIFKLSEEPYKVLLGDYNTSETKLLSIMIPTYKRKEMLIEAVESALKTSKNHDDVEVIVVSNDPEDSMDFLSKYKETKLIVIKNLKNLGMRNNINRAALFARGKYVSFLHDDDMLCDSYCNEVLDTIKSNEDIKCLIPGRKVMYPENDWGKHQLKTFKVKKMLKKVLEPRKYKKNLLCKTTINDVLFSGRNSFGAPSCGTLYLKDALLSIGLFENEWKYTFDLIMYSKFSKEYDIYFYKKPIGIYRMFESASNNPEVQLEFFEGLKYILDKYNVRKNYYEYLLLFYEGLSSAGELIMEKYGSLIKKASKFKCKLLRIKTLYYFYSHGLDIEY